MSAPSTAVAAWLASGAINDPRDIDADAFDWWFRCTFDDTEHLQTAEIIFQGIATLADVWVNGHHVATSDNMFREVRIRDVALHERDNEVVVRCRALRPELTGKRPRPRWKANFVDHQNLRWIRTALMGRMPSWTMPCAPVGIWRPVHVRHRPAAEMLDRSINARIDADGVGRCEFSAMFSTTSEITSATLHIDGAATPLDISLTTEPDVVRVRGVAAVANAKPWWPATHGDQALYTARLALRVVGEPAAFEIELPRLGFRSLEFDADDTQQWTVNGEPIFIRGVWWVTPDPISLNPTLEAQREALTQWRDAGVNMISLPASGTYEPAAFFDLCDELGILVWQQLMFTRFDYPVDDEAWAASARTEVAEQMRVLSGHPCVAMVCGGFEVEQQRAMLGLDPSMNATAFFAGPFADIVREALPSASYLADTPHGGTHPFAINEGTATYYGIGAYGRPTTDARRSGVRFASGCLAMAHIGSEDSVNQFIDRGASIHSAGWKRAIPRDHGGSWDMEDTRDRYIPSLFGLDPTTLRRTNPDRYLDIGRATSSLLVQEAISEWRTTNSQCKGALILHGRDYVAGTGCGLVDVSGGAKPAYYALRRTARPVTIAMVDEGLSGLDVWIHNDTAVELVGPLTISTFDASLVLASATTEVCVPPRSALRVPAEHVLGGFHDITYAFQFGAPQSEGVSASFQTEEQCVVRAVHVVNQTASVVQRDFALSATATPTGRIAGEYEVVVASAGFARFVQFSGRGITWSDQGFDLPPGTSATVIAHCQGPFRGRVRALNRSHSVAIECVQ